MKMTSLRCSFYICLALLAFVAVTRAQNGEGNKQTQQNNAANNNNNKNGNNGENANKVNTNGNTANNNNANANANSNPMKNEQTQNKPKNAMVEEEVETIEIGTPSGPLVGKVVESGEGKKSYYQFLGIPYAEAPVEALRFLEPQPKEPWTEAMNATSFKPKCPQPHANGSIIGEEDCLYLNVFTPRIPAQDSTRAFKKSSLLPVMIYIHGGNFIKGSGNMIPEPLVNKDVIVVTFNYRLGALGFLNLGHSSAPGNQGLKDQLQAFKWVQNHIIAFGGDPAQITVVGHSAGATSAQIHLLSPQGHGLYQGAIIQSGNLLYMNEQLRRGIVQADSARLARDVGCLDANPSELFTCMQELKIEDLHLNASGLPKDIAVDLEETLNGNGTFNFGPSIETASPNPILPQHPLELLNANRGKDIPLIVGFVENEGSMFLAQNLDNLEVINGNWSYYGPKIVFGSQYDDITDLKQLKANVTRHFYLGTKNITKEVQDDLVDFFSDAEYLAPGIHMIGEMTLSRNNPVFAYEIAHQPKSQSYLELVGGLKSANGANHGNDLLYLFNEIDDNEININDEEDMKVADVITTLWTNFAKHFDPTPYQNEDIPIWEEFVPHSEMILRIANSTETQEGFYPDRMYFWNKIVWGDIIEGSEGHPQPGPGLLPGPPIAIPQPAIDIPDISAPYTGLSSFPLQDQRLPSKQPISSGAPYQGQPGVVSPYKFVQPFRGQPSTPVGQGGFYYNI